jgi:hypothetical protein
MVVLSHIACLIYIWDVSITFLIIFHLIITAVKIRRVYDSLFHRQLTRLFHYQLLNFKSPCHSLLTLLHWKSSYALVDTLYPTASSYRYYTTLCLTYFVRFLRLSRRPQNYTTLYLTYFIRFLRLSRRSPTDTIQLFTLGISSGSYVYHTGRCSILCGTYTIASKMIIDFYLKIFGSS